MEERVVRSVLFSETEESRLQHFVPGRGASTWLLGLLRRDASELGLWPGRPAQLTSEWTKKLSLSLPAELDLAVTRRCAEVGFSAYVRGLLMSEPLTPIERPKVKPSVGVNQDIPNLPAKKMPLFERVMPVGSEEGPLMVASHLHIFLEPPVGAEETEQLLVQLEREEIQGLLSASGAILEPPMYSPHFARVVLGVQREAHSRKLRWLAEGMPSALRPLFDQVLQQVATNAILRNQRWEVHLRRLRRDWRTAVDCWILRARGH